MNDDNKKEVVSSGFSFEFVLFIVFLILKLCGVIDWPWLLVFAPLWVPIAFVLGIVTIWLFFAIIIKITSFLIGGE